MAKTKWALQRAVTMKRAHSFLTPRRVLLVVATSLFAFIFFFNGGIKGASTPSASGRSRFLSASPGLENCAEEPFNSLVARVRNRHDIAASRPKALVTGSAGFIASWVAEHALRLGLDVVCVDDLSGGFERNVPKGCKFVKGDVADAAFVKRLWQEHGPFPYVYHLAAYAAEGLSHFIRAYNYQNNLVASVLLMNQAINHDASCFVFTSSIAAFGTADTLPMREHHAQHPEDPYGISKHAVELDLRSAHEMFGLDYVIFRPHNVYGPRQNIADKFRNAIGIFINQLMRGESMTIFGDGKQTRGFSYIDDVAPYIAASPFVKRALNEDFFVGNDKQVSVYDLTVEVAHAMGEPHDLKHLPQRHEVVHAYASHDKLRCVFNVNTPVELREGLRKTVEYTRSLGSFEPTGYTKIEVPRKMPPSWAAALRDWDKRREQKEIEEEKHDATMTDRSRALPQQPWTCDCPDDVCEIRIWSTLQRIVDEALEGRYVFECGSSPQNYIRMRPRAFHLLQQGSRWLLANPESSNSMYEVANRNAGVGAPNGPVVVIDGGNDAVFQAAVVTWNRERLDECVRDLVKTYKLSGLKIPDIDTMLGTQSIKSRTARCLQLLKDQASSENARSVDRSTMFQKQFGNRIFEVLGNPILPTRDSKLNDREWVHWAGRRSRKLIKNDISYVAETQRRTESITESITDQGKRLRIGIIQIATTPWNSLYAVETMMTQCYAAKHGYGYHLAPMMLQTDRHLFSGRFRHALQYLPYYDYVVHLAQDMVIANHSKQIEDIAGMGVDDIIVPLRNFWRHDGGFPTRELHGEHSLPEHLHTELVVVRNSPTGRRFLTRLVGLADEAASAGAPDGILWDMGDIHAAAAEIMYTADRAARCNAFLLYYRKNGPKWYEDNVKNNDRLVKGMHLPFHPLYYLTIQYHMSECSGVVRPGSRGGMRILASGEYTREVNDHRQKFRRGTEFFLHTKLSSTWAQPQHVYCMEDDNGIMGDGTMWASSQEALDQSTMERLVQSDSSGLQLTGQCSKSNPRACPACAYGGLKCPCSGTIMYHNGQGSYIVQDQGQGDMRNCQAGSDHVCRCVAGEGPRDILPIQDERKQSENYLTRFIRATTNQAFVSSMYGANERSSSTAANSVGGLWAPLAANVRTSDVQASAAKARQFFYGSARPVATLQNFFDFLGPVGPKCHSLDEIGSESTQWDHEKKRFCGLAQFSKEPKCVVFSFGSANQWGFEADIVRRTNCRVETFDCTGDFEVPYALRDRVRFHKTCIASSSNADGKTYVSWEQAVNRYSSGLQIAYVKADIEGYEWSVLRDMVTGSSRPEQISVEMHRWIDNSQQFPKESSELEARLVSYGRAMLGAGYLLLDRNDNPSCMKEDGLLCSEVLYARFPMVVASD